MVYRSNLFTPGKKEYIASRASRSDDKCILCAIARGEEGVANLEVGRADGFVVTLNLYPYNPGHVMIFPVRHVEDPRELDEKENGTLIRLQNLVLDVLAEEYRPAGFNVGYNIGPAAGASIAHLHLHVVPRYRNELGVVDILSGAKILIEDPVETQARLRPAFARALGAGRLHEEGPHSG